MRKLWNSLRFYGELILEVFWFMVSLCIFTVFLRFLTEYILLEKSLYGEVENSVFLLRILDWPVNRPWVGWKGKGKNARLRF